MDEAYIEYISNGGTLSQADWETAGRPSGLDEEEASEEEGPQFPRLEDDPAFGSLDSMFGSLSRLLGINLTTISMERGWDPDSAFGEFTQIYDSPAFASWVEDYIWRRYDAVKDEGWARALGDQELYNQFGPGYFASMEGQQELAQAAWSWIGARSSMNLGDYPGAREVSRRSGSGSRGRTSLTPQEIRNQFDVDQLTEMVNGIWRNMLLIDNPKARDIAKAYVEEVVKTKGEKQIDFETFVRKRAKNTKRYANIFPAELPDGMTEEEYIGQYAAAASTVARPEDTARIAIQGAQLGSSQQQFAGRLARESRQQGSTPFMQSFGRRLGALSGVLKG